MHLEGDVHVVVGSNRGPPVYLWDVIGPNAYHKVYAVELLSLIHLVALTKCCYQRLAMEILGSLRFILRARPLSIGPAY